MNIKKQQKLLLSAAFSLAIRVIGAAAALIFQYILAKKAGVSGSGAYFFTISIVLILATLGRLGLDKIIPKHIAVSLIDNNREEVSSHVILTTITVFLCSTLVALLFYLLIGGPIGGFVNPEFLGSLKIGAPIIVFVSMYWLLSAFLVGIKEATLASIVQTVVTPIVGIIYIASIRGDVRGEDAVVAFGLGAIVSVIVGILLFQIRFGRWWGGRITKFNENLKVVTNSGIPIMLSNLSAQFTIYLPVLLLGIMSTAENTGIFAVAQRTAYATTIVLFASNVVLAPRVAAMWKNSEFTEIENISRLVALVMLIVSLPLFFPMIFYAEFVMSLFGPDFLHGSTLLVVLATSQLVNVITSSIGIVMTMTGYEKEVMNTSFLATLTCGVICIALIPAYGAMGAAIGSAVSTVLLHTSRVYVYYKGTGIVVIPGFKAVMNRDA